MTFPSHADLVSEAIDRMRLTLNHWWDYDEVRTEETVRRAATEFASLSHETLTAICSYGRENGRDAVAEYLGVVELLNTGEARDEHYEALANALNVPFGAYSSVEYVYSENTTSHCPSLVEYNKIIDACAPSTAVDAPVSENAYGARSPYHLALAMVTLSLLKADQLSSEDEDASVSLQELLPKFPKSPVINDLKLVELVVRNINRAENIVRFIKERKVTSRELIEEYLTQPSSVSSGII